MPPPELGGGVPAPNVNPPFEAGKPDAPGAGEAGCEPAPNVNGLLGVVVGELNAKGVVARKVDGLPGAEPALDAPEPPKENGAAVGGAVIGCEPNVKGLDPRCSSAFDC